MYFINKSLISLKELYSIILIGEIDHTITNISASREITIFGELVKYSTKLFGLDSAHLNLRYLNEKNVFVYNYNMNNT